MSSTIHQSSSPSCAVPGVSSPLPHSLLLPPYSVPGLQSRRLWRREATASTRRVCRAWCTFVVMELGLKGGRRESVWVLSPCRLPLSLGSLREEEGEGGAGLLIYSGGDVIYLFFHISDFRGVRRQGSLFQLCAVRVCSRNESRLDRDRCRVQVSSQSQTESARADLLPTWLCSPGDFLPECFLLRTRHDQLSEACLAVLRVGFSALFVYRRAKTDASPAQLEGQGSSGSACAFLYRVRHTHQGRLRLRLGRRREEVQDEGRLGRRKLDDEGTSTSDGKICSMMRRAVPMNSRPPAILDTPESKQRTL